MGDTLVVVELFCYFGKCKNHFSAAQQYPDVMETLCRCRVVVVVAAASSFISMGVSGSLYPEDFLFFYSIPF